jgi:hypothetical protein
VRTGAALSAGEEDLEDLLLLRAERDGGDGGLPGGVGVLGRVRDVAKFPAAEATVVSFASLTPSARASRAADDRAARAAAPASLIAASCAHFHPPSAVIRSTEAATATASAMTEGRAGALVCGRKR